MLRLEPWEVTHAFRGTNSLGRLTASIGSGWGALVQRRAFWVVMWVAAAVAELVAPAARAVRPRSDGIGGAEEGARTGLRGLADRVEALDGRLRVMSLPGGGTTVTAELPCAS